MVPIYEVVVGNTTTYQWLCPTHARGKATGRTTPHPCDDCPREAVAFVPVLTTDGVWRGPGPKWKPDAPMKPWARPVEKQRTTAVKEVRR